MHLAPREQERLLVRAAADTARGRRERGLLLNHPEAVAVLTDWVLEGARDGRRVADLMQDGRHVLTGADVLPGVAALVPEVQVEATFPDGTKLVTLHQPIVAAEGADVDDSVDHLHLEGSIGPLARAEVGSVVPPNPRASWSSDCA